MTWLRFRAGVVTYPYSFHQLRLDNPHVSFPAEMGAALMLEFDVFDVAPVARPAPSDSIAKNVVEIEPIPVAGVWTQQWAEVNATAQEIAARTQAATDEAHRLLVKADSFVTNFIAMTPAQVASYIDTNVTNLATSKTVITKLAQMVLLLVRREYRNGAGA
jgi:hypothetical protein